MSRNKKRGLVGAALAIALVLAIAGVSGAFGGGDAVDVPTTAVVKGEFIDYMQVRGEVKAVRSIPLTAPSSAGDLQILELAKNGMNVKKGDVVVKFDPVPVQRTHAEKLSELKQAEEEIGKTEAQYRIQEQQADMDLAKARYDVQRAELDAATQEFLPRLEGEQKKVALASARERQREAERKLKALRDISRAEVASKRQKRDKAKLDVQQAERQLGALQLVTPVDGVVNIMPNWRSCCPPPDFKAGDRAWPGQIIADVPDLATMRVTARLEEAERGRMQPGQKVVVRADAVPDRELTGRIDDISTLARIDFSNWPPQRNFDLIVQLDQTDPRLRPGMTTAVRVAVDRVADAVLIPVRAVFEKDGRSVAYVPKARGGWDERVVKIARRGQEQLVVTDGVKPDERVALKDPIPAVK
ncbi:MAG TPA: HlyD family efflux transporter periplasmic adaptor subunit [Vicinamibacterales bacterium]|jgi:HlyD family secretion protein|nr:HlyD family efflux transporter periplasmic adaptor subunit [Vicinamibacterales bacterium]